ncbi:MAG: DNA topoisomerase IV subunit B [Alphaproteobacteria bacterium]
MARAKPKSEEPGLFDEAAAASGDYNASDIEVLEGLEPVRRRPGMYIGGTDDRALHHLAAEILDNSMDEAVAGHADRIEMSVSEEGTLTISDNGRGIPIDPHPKYKGKSALEVILTTLHSGGKFDGKVYQTSGGLHGVGLSVVNALASKLRVEVARDKQLWVQEYSRGAPQGKLEKQKGTVNRRGTTISFDPDPDIFGAKATFEGKRLFDMAKAKAYLFRGVEIRWSCDPSVAAAEDIPEKETFQFPDGILDYLRSTLGERPLVGADIFAGRADLTGATGRIEWAISWPADGEGFVSAYCNTVPTPEGGSHVAGIRGALTRGLKGYGELTNNRKASQLTAEDISDGAAIVLSLFIAEPQFQGQTKEKLSMPEAARIVEAQIKDHFDHHLSTDRQNADALLEWAIERAEDRKRRKEDRALKRKTAGRKSRLPGKLADCSQSSAEGTEIFLVEGDSAGGSAKQARNRKTQAILPLRGKILNVASASADKLRGNQELSDLIQALGCGSGKTFDLSKLRYERVVIMTDADVDGAHIASLLMTFFYREMPELVTSGHLFLAVPPLYRLARGGDVVYALDDADRERLTAEHFKGSAKIEISRFKGLGEMPPRQLKDTTMDPDKRQLIQVSLPSATDTDADRAKLAKTTAQLVEQLMGRKAERRFQFIQDNAKFVEELDV